MPEIPKLSPEVELPRPRSSGVAVVAVAALAMFTAVGASAFIVRVRMGMNPYAMRYHAVQARLDRALAEVDRESARLDLAARFVAAVAAHDDRTALELYAELPEDVDASGHLVQLRETVIARQMDLLQEELARGDCDELRRHVAWLRQATHEDLSVHVGECRDARPRFITVELAP